MNAIDIIRGNLQASHAWTMGLIMDLQDAPTASAVPGGNHALWVLGHLIGAEKSMLGGFILGEASVPGEDDALFGMGSAPQADAAKYPSLQELAARFEKARARTLEVLATLSEADLDRPSHAPPALKGLFGTIGQCFGMIATHQVFHAGQVSDTRRSLGRKPLFG